MPEVQESKVNVNEGTLKELISVNGLGPSLSQRIIEDRPYEQLSDLVRVSGINDLKLASLLPFITLEVREEQARRPKTLSESSADKHVKSSTEPCQSMTFTLFEISKNQQAAILIVLGGFFFGLFMLLLRRRCK
jgi:hypothetical protein